MGTGGTQDDPHLARFVQPLHGLAKLLPHAGVRALAFSGRLSRMRAIPPSSESRIAPTRRFLRSVGLQPGW
jgi:hypothetical protein